MERALECLESIIEKLTDRNEELEAERLAALSDNDALTAENIQLRRELAAKHGEVA